MIHATPEHVLTSSPMLTSPSARPIGAIMARLARFAPIAAPISPPHCAPRELITPRNSTYLVRSKPRTHRNSVREVNSLRSRSPSSPNSRGGGSSRRRGCGDATFRAITPPCECLTFLPSQLHVPPPFPIPRKNSKSLKPPGITPRLIPGDWDQRRWHELLLTGAGEDARRRGGTRALPKDKRND